MIAQILALAESMVFFNHIAMQLKEKTISLHVSQTFCYDGDTKASICLHFCVTGFLCVMFFSLVANLEFDLLDKNELFQIHRCIQKNIVQNADEKIAESSQWKYRGRTR